jgi:hypothetical protein
MSLFKSLSIDDIRQRGSIHNVDVQSLRQNLAENDAISALEADLLLMLNTACRIKDASWSGFFVETLTDYLVHQTAPEGYVTAATAEWLALRFSRDGRITNHAELDLVVSIIEEARWVPLSLPLIVLRQVRAGIATGQGPLRAGAPVPAGVITDTEVELVRRVLVACDDALPVTRAEAEALFEINAALSDPASHPGWAELYVTAIANAVMWAAGYAVAARSDALGKLEVVSDAAHASDTIRLPCGITSDEIAARLSAADDIAQMNGPAAFSTCRPQSSEERALARLERQRIEIITHDKILEPDIDWLVGQIGGQISARGGQASPNEHRLLARIERSSPALHPALEPLLKTVA